MYPTALFRHRTATALSIGMLLLLLAVLNVVYGTSLSAKGIEVRRWYWDNVLFVLPVLPLLLLQERAGLPPADTVRKGGAWKLPVLSGFVFGLLDVLVIKVILHPEPYTSLPPFLQPFPYSLFLYSAGALEVELTYRMLPLTLVLLVHRWVWKDRGRNAVLVILGVLTSVIEPILQFPSGPVWLLVYATVSGLAMNGLQFYSYVRSGFLASMVIRLSHYLVWHILLGVYVQWVELG